MRRFTQLLSLALLAAACGSASDALARPAMRTPFAVTPVVRLDDPWAMAFLPDGRLIVTEKPGRVRIITQAGTKSAPLGGVPKVAYEGQGGLLDIMLSPGFATDHFVYLTYAEPGRGGSSLAMARGTLVTDAKGSRLDGLTVLWRQQPKGGGGQFGGVIAFAPDGESLFLTVGERMRKTPAQDPASALGKILHLTLDGKPWRDNPLTSGSGVPVAGLWTSGHRNPYGLAFAPDGKLWEVEMGPMGGDELNLVQRGRNYGWPVVSQGDNYDGTPIPRHATHPEFKPPVVAWNPVISPSSLVFYSGAMFPQWRGSSLIGGLSSEALIRVTFDGHGGAQEAERFDMRARIRCVRQGPDGAVWLLEDGEGGRLLRLTPPR